MRFASLILALLLAYPAQGKQLCYSTLGQAHTSPIRLPDILILKDAPRRGLWAQRNDRELDWIGPQDKKRYGRGSFWKRDGDRLLVIFGNGFSGLRLALTPMGKTLIGTATYYADVPTPPSPYNIKLLPVKCSSHRSNNSFKPKPLRGSA